MPLTDRLGDWDDPKNFIIIPGPPHVEAEPPPELTTGIVEVPPPPKHKLTHLLDPSRTT